MPALTIGMAVHSDWDGPYFTVESLRLHNDLRDVELLLIDNKPDSPQSPHLKALMAKADRRGNAGARYIPMPEPQGTSAPRNRVFSEATGEAVMCIDSHILLPGGTINRLIDWYAQHPDSLDLLSGPLVYDTLDGASTHFGDSWGGEMWGQWRSAWATPDGTIFDVTDESGTCRFNRLSLNPERVDLGIKVPFHGHERVLTVEHGFRPLGMLPDDEFEIPGQGLGLFTCRKAAWLGFNEHWRGFGGEELQIHEKYRQAGRKCLSLGFLRWVHRFGHVSGAPPYPATRYNKIRNYVIGHNELGLPLDAIHREFVASGKMPRHEWEFLIADPIAHTQETVPRPDKATAPGAQPPTVEAIYGAVQSIPRDLNQHMPTLLALAEKCEKVTEFTRRRESTIAFAAGQPELLISHNSFEANDPALRNLQQVCPALQLDSADSSAVDAIEPTDLLFLKTVHTGERLAEELAKYAPNVRRFIVLGDTLSHGERGPGGEPGYWYALRPFVAENPEWFVYSHTPNQFGLTVLGRRSEDRPDKPIQAWPPGFGPGTELGSMLKQIGIEPKKGCGCRALAERMDYFGAEGCRVHRADIIRQIKLNHANWGWAEAVANAAKFTAAKLKGLFDFPVDWTDPYTGFVEEAIRRAEAQEQAQQRAA